MSKVQSVIFGSGWDNISAKKWLKANNFKPIGRVRKTKTGKSRKFIIQPEKNFDKLGFKPIRNKGIFFMIGTPKDDVAPPDQE